MAAMQSESPRRSMAFRELLQLLSDQYELDMAEAHRQTNGSAKNGHAGICDEEKNEAEASLETLGACNWFENAMPKPKEDADATQPDEVRNPCSVVPRPAAQQWRHSTTTLADEREKRYSIKRDKEDAPEPSRLNKIVSSDTFSHVTAVILLTNALFIGVQVGYTENVPFSIQLIDYAYCVVFLLELMLRLCGHGCRDYWCDPSIRGWNIFDFVVVSISTMDALGSLLLRGQVKELGNISILRVIRVARITRVLRIIRALKFFQDLRIMLASIASTLKTASFALLLIIVAIYMWSIAITQIVTDFMVESKRASRTIQHEKDMEFFFGSLFKTMFAMLMTIAGGIDWRDAAVPLMEASGVAFTLYLCFVLFMTFCVLNVVTGIFCQCAVETANNDRDNVIRFQLQEKTTYVRMLTDLFQQWDDNGNGKCTYEEFHSHLEDRETQALLNSLGIDARDALTLFEMLDVDEGGDGEIDLDEFVTGCITLRGGAKAVQLEKAVSANYTMTAALEKIDSALSQLQRNAFTIERTQAQTAWTAKLDELGAKLDKLLCMSDLAKARLSL
eukprot:TRINITY_DN62606_c0_g1_i1.p1 TRINITY_DN62606_c0_g1~~TRINITY_DN62606_c0_g1_i1.p1  ORF type:complete len:604 (+),score=104.96 TRINITY_DN62606_c0_g1_i1:131-1813(+)